MLFSLPVLLQCTAGVYPLNDKLMIQPKHLDRKCFEEMFDPGPNLIILEDDENLGYVYLTIQYLLNQYELINVKHDFGKTTINDPWYIAMISCLSMILPSASPLSSATLSLGLAYPGQSDQVRLESYA